MRLTRVHIAVAVAAHHAASYDRRLLDVGDIAFIRTADADLYPTRSGLNASVRSVTVDAGRLKRPVKAWGRRERGVVR